MTNNISKNHLSLINFYKCINIEKNFINFIEYEKFLLNHFN